jgi:hypothetical protein
MTQSIKPPRCPTCGGKSEAAGYLFRCKSCGGFHDGDPDEGGSAFNDPTKRIEVLESQQRRGSIHRR